jgi:hypothetical protein
MNKLFKSQDNAEEVIKGKQYKGVRINYNLSPVCRGVCVVTVDNKPLLSQSEDNFFEWGVRWASGSRNLAASLLLDMFKEDHVTKDMITSFTDGVIAKLPFEMWELTEDMLDGWDDIYQREMEKYAKQVNQILQTV